MELILLCRSPLFKSATDFSYYSDEWLMHLHIMPCIYCFGNEELSSCCIIVGGGLSDYLPSSSKLMYAARHSYII